MEYGSGGNLEVQMDGPFAGSGVASGGVKLAIINAPVADWKGGESPYSMAVAVDGVSVSSKVDLQLSGEQIIILSDQLITFMTENNSGEVTLYAFGDKPKADLVLQATVVDTNMEGAILGNSVATGASRSDYSQTDPAKADYIRNKPDAAISKAQATADSAKEIAEAALPRTGGKMTGGVDLGGNGITNLAAPTGDNHAANKGYVDTKVAGAHLEAQVTVTASGWSASAPYTQAVNVNGILATDRVHWGVVYSGDAKTKLSQKEAFAMVDDLDSAAGKVTFTCFEEKPEVSLTIALEVNR